jgi:phosphopantothenoylcysteine decarboxylase/phosphopantothenate--cysteine ligase
VQNKQKITLIIGGGIAAYKCLELIRRLADEGISTVPVLTRAGSEFVTPLSVAALAEHQVYEDLFDLKNETEIGHIQLSRQSDLVVVAPATADLMAKCANGLAGDLASTLLLATDKPILMAPAMNVKMWEHPATRRNASQLQDDGVHFIGPDVGSMACGETGPGRMAEVSDIIKAIKNRLTPKHQDLSLAGKTVLVTAGPTHEPIDPVRFIANRSSGKQGYAVAAEAAKRGAKVTLVSGPTNLEKPPKVTRINVETAKEMLKACESAGKADIIICAAAVADWRVDKAKPQKMKKTKAGLPALKLKENPDILKTLSKKHKGRAPLIIGFAAETQNILKNAKAKRAAKKCDWIVANDVSATGNVFGNDLTTIHIIAEKGVETFENISKTEAATRLMEKAAAHLLHAQTANNTRPLKTTAE